jgi:hypothetical protein
VYLVFQMLSHLHRKIMFSISRCSYEMAAKAASGLLLCLRANIREKCPILKYLYNIKNGNP